MATSGADRTLAARWLLGVATGALLLAALVQYGRYDPSIVFSDLAQTALAFLAAANCALAAFASGGRLRLAWAALSGASLLWALGQVVWDYFELVRHTATPFPSIADLGYLGFPVFAVLALMVFPADISRNGRWRMGLDGLMSVSAVGLVSWATALGAVVRAGGDSPLSLVVSVAYPASDIALVVACLVVLARTRRHRVPMAVVATSLAVMAFADSGFAYLVAVGAYATTSWVDLGWMFAFGLLALASLTKGAIGDSPPRDRPMIAGAAMPYVVLAAALGFMTWQMNASKAVSAVEMVLFVVLVASVLTRQLLTVRDNQTLARTVTEREAQLRHQAFHDPLTGLANRALFLDRAAHALDLHRRDRRPLGICFLDLDGFKAVNDGLGHSAGDQLLTEVAARFRSWLTKTETLARFGGDEFAVLVEDHPDPSAVAQALLDSLRAPFTIAGLPVTVTSSIGVACVSMLDPTPDVDELLGRADVAMYVVKQRGGAGVLLHSEGLVHAEIDDITLGRALPAALRRGEVTVAYQPIVDLRTGRVNTLEALARWAPNGRAVPPETLVRVANRCSLNDALFGAMLDQACAALAQWVSTSDGEHLRIGVNITPGQLSSRQLPNTVAAHLRRHGLSGERLTLEITETAGLADLGTSRAVCDELRTLGVRLSVDDLGAGQSTLTRLRDLPIDEVKIDRSFIGDLDRDESRRRFVWGVVAFAQRVGVTVVAEGVERQGELDALRRLGCPQAQGFLFSRPVPAEGITSLLASGRHWRASATLQIRGERG